MLKKKIDNPRYPHCIRILRSRPETESNNPLARQLSEDVEYVIYDGRGRSFTDTTTDGDNQVDRNKRKASIPMRFDRWGPLGEGCGDILYPKDGDTIIVKMGNVFEYGRVKDFEPDNDRSIIYWEYVRN